MIAIVYLSDGKIATYEVEKDSYFNVKEDAERKIRNWGGYSKVVDVKFIEADNRLSSPGSQLITKSKEYK